jgi:branched-chain amino acid transport system ATP-binding protein
LLEVSDLKVQRAEFKVLHGVTLKVPEGRLCSLVGANGSGKTTLLGCISGLIRNYSGKVRFAGQEITALGPHQIARLGLIQVPEGRKLFPEMTVLENLIVGSTASSKSISVRQNLEQVFSIFPRLQERHNQLALSLSGGEGQMLAIARGLMGQPRLLMLDEPSMGLAPLVVREIFEVFRKLNQSGMTILLVEQNVKQSLRISHYTYVLENGRIALEGSSSALLQDPHTQQAYLGM